MKTLIFFLTVICAAYAYNFICLTYNCSTDPVDVGEVCATQHINGLKLNKCKENYVCESIEYDNPSTCVKLKVSNHSLLPGEKCNESNQCISNDCNKNGSIHVCKGWPIGKSCEFTAQCDTGSYCKNKRCAKTGDGCDEKGEGCSADQICIKKDKKCVRIASKKNDEISSVPAECESYYHENGKCVEGPRLTNLHTRECEEHECRYLVGNKEIKTPCVCAKNDKVNKSCPPGRGDIDTKAVMLVLTH